MQHLIGIVLFGFGASLLYLARVERRWQASASGRAAGPQPFARLRQLVTPLFAVLGALAAIRLVMAYFAIGSGTAIEPLEAAGFLFLVAAYGAWLVATTGKAKPTPVPAARRKLSLRVIEGGRGGPEQHEQRSADLPRDLAGAGRRARPGDPPAGPAATAPAAAPERSAPLGGADRRQG